MFVEFIPHFSSPEESFPQNVFCFHIVYGDSISLLPFLVPESCEFHELPEIFKLS